MGTKHTAPAFSDDLQTIASNAGASAKTAAFGRVRAALVKDLDTGRKLAAVAAVNQKRFPIWDGPAPPWCGDGDEALRLRVVDGVRGCLFGGAVADAVGLMTEFMAKAQVEAHYGPILAAQDSLNARTCLDLLDAPFPDTHRTMWLKGDWTDDTDQSVLLLQALCEGGGCVDAVNFAAKLKEWVASGFRELGDESAAGLGQSTKHVVGSDTFLRDPVRAAEDIWTASGKRLAANGAVMRTCVTGIPYFYASPGEEGAERVVETTLAACRVTHADPRCQASCVTVAVAVAGLLRMRVEHPPTGDASFATAMDQAAQVHALVQAAVDRGAAVLACDHVAEFRELTSAVLDMSCVRLLDGARRATDEETRAQLAALCKDASATALSALDLDEPRSIGYTFKCTACALWALLDAVNSTVLGTCPPADRFAQTLLRVVLEGGDADTNGAVAGGLMGCYLGWSGMGCGDVVRAMPHATWLEAWVQKLLVMMSLTARPA
eukprot:TRINITY_DN4297_c0_g1_i2.p1 TRINITY_DN4297_c0_g1~~TRINITY_DN4297_c0_g1_i2.p1  ORF type:complete len:492 (+),score=146.04 TRINITY_DN4297_c0_g1_i2:36-1511(+)